MSIEMVCPLRYADLARVMVAKARFFGLLVAGLVLLDPVTMVAFEKGSWAQLMRSLSSTTLFALSSWMPPRKPFVVTKAVSVYLTDPWRYYYAHKETNVSNRKKDWWGLYVGNAQLS